MADDSPREITWRNMLEDHEVSDPFRARMYRIVFTVAAIYNLAFGAWAGFWPQAFFRWMELEAPRYPSIWACLGMVVGVYGLLYGLAAWKLERAWPLIAVGLLGKLLGPAGLMVNASQGELPLRMLSLLVFNDLIWWVPFSMFLLEGTRISQALRRAAPYLCAGLHTLAIFAMLFAVAGGSEVEPQPQQRARYIVDNLPLWRAGWAVWMASAMSLIGFYGWWGGRIASTRLAILAIFVAAAGLACDLSGETLYVAWLPGRAEELLKAPQAGLALERFLSLQQLGTTLTAVFANGLYTLAGILLTLGTPSLKGKLLWLTWTLWMFGALMSVSAIVGNLTGVMVSTAGLFPLFVVWCVWMGKKLSCAA